MAVLFAPVAASPIGWSDPRPEHPWLSSLFCFPDWPSLQCLLDGPAECVETRVEVTGDVRPQGAPPAFGKDLEIAARLRRLDDPEGVPGARDREVVGVGAGDLQEHAAVRAALVGLPGGVQEARAEAEACRQLLAVADHQPQFLHRADVRRSAVDISEQRYVVADAGAIEMRFQS